MRVSLRSLLPTAVCAAALGVCAPSSVRAQGFSPDDTTLRFDGTRVSPLSGTARVGFTSTPTPGGGLDAIFVYQLPTLTPNTTITSAVFSVNLAAVTVPGSVNFNVDLYALPFRSTTAVSSADFFAGPTDPSPTSTLIQNDFVAPPEAAQNTPLGRYETSSASSITLANFLNAQYAAGATGGATGDYVFLRLNPDTTVGSGFGGLDFNTQDNASTSNLRPTLTLTTAAVQVAPEPTSAALALTAPLMLGAARLVRRRKALKTRPT